MKIDYVRIVSSKKPVSTLRYGNISALRASNDRVLAVTLHVMLAVTESAAVGLREGITEPAVMGQLEKILASASFTNSERLSRFLRFAVQASAQGQSVQLKEYAVALAVFDKRDSFDPRYDPIVRVEAGRLRTRLRVALGLPTPARSSNFDLASITSSILRRRMASDITRPIEVSTSSSTTCAISLALSSRRASITG